MGKDSQVCKERTSKPKMGKRAKSSGNAAVSGRTRSKRSIETEPNQAIEDDQPQIKFKKSNKGAKSNTREPAILDNSRNCPSPMDSNNNATLANQSKLPAEHIVGSAKSLIDSIKNRKASKAKTQKFSDNTQPGTSTGGTTKQGRCNTKVKRGKVAKAIEHLRESDPDDYDEYDRNDGVDLDINPSDDDYGRCSSSSQSSSSESSSSSDESGSESDPVHSPRCNIPRDVSDQDLSDIDYDQLQELRSDPKVRRVLNLMYEEDQKERQRYQDKYGDSHRDHVKRRGSKTRSRSISKGKFKVPKKPVRIATKQSKVRHPNLKSPSDVTLYTPALRKDATVANSPTLNNLATRNWIPTGTQTSIPNDGARLNQAIDQISDLVEKIRVHQRGKSREREVRSRSRSRARSPVRGDSRPREEARDRNDGNPVSNHDSRDDAAHGRTVRPEVEEGRALAEQLILDAERFKASVQPPKGNYQVHNVEDDDEFFHLTCHLDGNLKTKIENGEFVDLDRLLPKTRSQLMKEDQTLQQFVTKSGSTYWAPPDRESRITNIRKWEQAFRVYAAVYTKANPTRASEVWQYVYVINTAAASFAWENVYYYDFTFRQLMAERPTRNWGKTYNQLWNLAMCDHLPKSGPFIKGNGGDQNSGSRTTSWKDRCCWRFNRGNKCRKYNCRFDHRCNSCGSWTHGKNRCDKRNGGDDQSYARSPPRSPKSNNYRKRGK